MIDTALGNRPAEYLDQSRNTLLYSAPVAPAGAPCKTMDKLSANVHCAMTGPDVKRLREEHGILSTPCTSGQFADRINPNIDKCAKDAQKTSARVG